MLVIGPDVNIAEFTHMLCKREQLILEDIEDRVRAAHTLCAYYEGGLTGISAIKRPTHSYRDHIEDKAHIDELPDLELGWFYVDPIHRTRGIGAMMMQALMPVPSFATTTVHNIPMERILSNAGFEPIGRTYWSSQGEYKLHVWLHP